MATESAHRGGTVVPAQPATPTTPLGPATGTTGAAASGASHSPCASTAARTRAGVEHTGAPGQEARGQEARGQEDGQAQSHEAQGGDQEADRQEGRAAPGQEARGPQDGQAQGGDQEAPGPKDGQAQGDEAQGDEEAPGTKDGQAQGDEAQGNQEAPGPKDGQAQGDEAQGDQASLTVEFVLDGSPRVVEVAPDESLLSVLREHLGVRSVKDGCAPQGQCGCCTVLVDGRSRIACVTPVARVAGRVVTTLDGLEPGTRVRLADAFTAAGGSQCGFCTPGILVRAAALLGAGRTEQHVVRRALAAHLCRCTGWQTILEAIESAAERSPAPPSTRSRAAAGRRATLEGGGVQRVDEGVPLGAGGFADDTAPPGCLVAIPLPPGSSAESVPAAGLQWVVDVSLPRARARAAKVQGRRHSARGRPPLPLPDAVAGGVRLATTWVEPAYLEPDASWCLPGGDPATPLANGGAFGAKRASVAPMAARHLADELGSGVRVVWSREDCVRLGPKRPPVAARAALRGRTLEIDGTVVARVGALDREAFSSPYAFDAVHEHWRYVTAPGPPTAPMRAFPLAERTVLVEGAVSEAGTDRTTILRDDRAAGVLLDSCALDPEGAMAGARVVLHPATGALERVEVRVAGGDPLDETVMRSYCIGAAHMALGWVLSEGVTVDPASGEVLDLTIRSFGVLRAVDTPPIHVEIVDDPGEPLPRASDAAFAAVAAAMWNAVSIADGERPEIFPARDCRAAATLRR